MTENAGTIYFTVEAETAKLIRDLEVTNKRLESLESGFNKTDASAKKADMQLTKTAAAVRNLGNEGAGAERKIGGLVKMLGGLIAVQGAGGLIQMAESYNEMAERVRMATSSVEEYDKVQARLLKTANGTYRALAEAQEIYIQTSDGLRSMGYSTDQALDITDSLSYSFVKNATAVDRAQSAMRAYDLALNKGKVDATGWLTVVGAIPSVVGDIAAATGKTDEEIRRMGASGEITARMLNEGLRQSLEANKKAADDMATTVRDAFTNLRTNLSVYLGEANNSTGATQALAAAIGLLGDNIDIVVTALSIAGAGALAKYIASMGLAAVQAGLAGVASRNAAGAALTEAKARSAAATAALAHARANIGLTTTVVQLAAAEKAAEVASKGLAAAQAAATAAGSGFLALLGGPAGLVGLVAATAIGFLTLGSNARAAVPDVEALGQSLAGLRKEELEKRLQDQGDLMRELSKKSQESAAALRGLEKDYDDLGKMMQSGAVSPDELENVNKALVDQRAELAKTQRDLQTAAQTYANLAVAISNAASAQRDLNNAYNDSQSDDFLQRLKDQKAAIEDGNSAVKQAERYIKTLTNVSPERIEQIREEAKALDAARKAQERHTTGTKSANSALEDAKRGAEENGRALQRMAEQIALAHLEGEQLAVVQARLSMNQYATPEQLESAEKLAIALHKVNEAQKLKTKVGDDPIAYIRGTDEPLSGGAFDDQVARYDAEDKREQERYEAQLVRLRESLEAKSVTMEQYHAEFERAQQNHNDRLNQIDEARTSVMLSTASSAFGEMASLLKSAQGEQSGAYKAMFAISKAFAIADAGIKLNTAIMQAMTAPDALTPAQKFANYAAVASAGVGVLNSISSATFGGRQYGGPAQPGKMYRINENGAPEVFNAANGQQFMMANSRGQVVSNKDATGGAGGLSVQIHNYGGAQIEQRMTKDELIIEIDKRVPGIMATEARNGNSQFRKSMGQYTDLKPRR